MASRENCDKAIDSCHSSIDDLKNLLRRVGEELADLVDQPAGQIRIGRIQAVQRRFGKDIQKIATDLSVTATNLKARV